MNNGVLKVQIKAVTGTAAQFCGLVIDIPVNFESGIITGRYCTNYDWNDRIFPGAKML